jgi:hypothetical protein
MADIPEDSVNINQDEAVENSNPDSRVNSIMKDRRVEADNEFEEGKSGNRNAESHSNGGAEPMEVENGKGD